MALTSTSVCSGRSRTLCAPMEIATCKVAASGSVRPQTNTAGRRGSPAQVQPVAASRSSTTAAAADHTARTGGREGSRWAARTPAAAAARSTSSRREVSVRRVRSAAVSVTAPPSPGAAAGHQSPNAICG